MYKFCKLYESVFERHTIACIVYLTLSFLIILLLLLMPHGLVKADSVGSSADTSVIVGDTSDSGVDNYLHDTWHNENSFVKSHVNESINNMNDSYFSSQGISAVKLSDMFEVSDYYDTDQNIPHISTQLTYHSAETVNNFLNSVYLVNASAFYEFPYYQFLITEGSGWVNVIVSNCSEQTYFSNRDGLTHWTADSSSQLNTTEFFSSEEFNCEIITIYDDGNIEYYYFNNLDISEYYGFRYSQDPDYWGKFDGPFYWNYPEAFNLGLLGNNVIASNMIYVEYDFCGLYSFENNITSKNGFNNVAAEDDEDDLGDDSNHLYLDGANWNFNNVPKKFLSNNGNIYFQCVGLDEYQQNHLNNFYLNYDFKIECSVNYNTFLGFHSGGGGGHSFGTSAKNYKFSDSLYSYYKEMGNYYSSFLPTQTSIRIPHKDTFVFYYKNPQDNTSYYRQTLEQFYNSGDKATFFTKNYLYDNCYGLARIDDDGSQHNCSFSNFIYSLDTLYDEWAIENVTITCNAQIFDIEGGQGGNCKSSYNFVNGVENRIDTGISINPNPYYGSGVDVATGTNANSNSNSSVINSGNINIENNPSIVINNDNSGKDGGDTNFIIDLIGIITGGGNQDLGSLDPDNNGFFEWMGVNRWLQVLNQSFGYVPSSIFTVLGLYFGVVCLILIAAFVLKIIVEFL